jgi:ribosomal protein S16
LKPERIYYWLSVGAQMSERVSYICGKVGILPTPPHRQSVETAIPKEFREKKKEAAPVKKPAAGSVKK